MPAYITSMHDLCELANKMQDCDDVPKETKSVTMNRFPVSLYNRLRKLFKSHWQEPAIKLLEMNIDAIENSVRTGRTAD